MERWITLLAAAGLLAASLASTAALATEAGTVNINAATAQELATAIPGVGARRAEAIVAYRELHGPFKTVEDLAQVSGIGSRIVAESRAKLRVE